MGISNPQVINRFINNKPTNKNKTVKMCERTTLKNCYFDCWSEVK